MSRLSNGSLRLLGKQEEMDSFWFWLLSGQMKKNKSNATQHTAFLDGGSNEAVDLQFSICSAQQEWMSGCVMGDLQVERRSFFACNLHSFGHFTYNSNTRMYDGFVLILILILLLLY